MENVVSQPRISVKVISIWVRYHVSSSISRITSSLLSAISASVWSWSAHSCISLAVWMKRQKAKAKKPSNSPWSVLSSRGLPGSSSTFLSIISKLWNLFFLGNLRVALSEANSGISSLRHSSSRQSSWAFWSEVFSLASSWSSSPVSISSMISIHIRPCKSMSAPTVSWSMATSIRIPASNPSRSCVSIISLSSCASNSPAKPFPHSISSSHTHSISPLSGAISRATPPKNQKPIFLLSSICFWDWGCRSLLAQDTLTFILYLLPPLSFSGENVRGSRNKLPLIIMRGWTYCGKWGVLFFWKNFDSDQFFLRYFYATLTFTSRRDHFPFGRVVCREAPTHLTTLPKTGEFFYRFLEPWPLFSQRYSAQQPPLSLWDSQWPLSCSIHHREGILCQKHFTLPHSEGFLFFTFLLWKLL